MKTITPLNDYVLIEPVIETTGTLRMPEQDNTQTFEGIVVDFGEMPYNPNDCDFMPMSNPPPYLAGEKVIFNFYKSLTIKIDDKEYKAVRPDAIIAIIKETE